MSSVRDLFVGIKFQDEASAVIKKVDKSVDDVESKVVGLGRELDDAEYGFISLGKTGIRASDKIGDSLDDAGDEASELNKRIKNIESSLSGLKRAAVGLGSVIAGAFAIDKIKDFSISAVEAAASTQALNSQFSQVFGDLEQKATANMNEIAQEAGMLPSRLQGSFTQIAAFAKTTGMDTSDALSLTERAMRVAADSAAFYDRSIEEVTENLQSFLKGNYENDAALGISATETTRNAAAMKLYGKEFNKLTEMQKQFTLLSMVEEGNKLSGALGQAARESDTFENQLGNLKQAWTDFKSVIGGPLLEPVVSGMKDVTEWLQNLDTEKIANGIQRAAEFGATLKDTVFSIIYNTGEVSDLWQNFGLSKEASDTIEGIGEVLRTAVVGGVELAKTAFDGLKIGIQWLVEHKDAVISVGTGLVAGFAAFKTATAISSGVSLLSTALTTYRTAGMMATAAQLGLNTAMLASPITWVAVGIGALVAAGIALYKNWDVVKEKAIGLWQVIQENPILNFLTKPIQWAVMAGISLYQNFDTIKEKAGQLWQRLIDNPMLALVAGPIGGLIAAGITLYQNWDTIKLKAGELWTKTQEVFGGIYEWGSTKIQGVVGFFQNLYNKFTQFKDAISNFKPPEWVSKIGGAISSGISKVKSLVDGSHATGLAKVPFDGYRAELHKGEAVLTAQQSNTLRAAGILREKGDGTPELRIDSLQQPANTNNYNSSSSLDIGEAVLTAQQSNALRSAGILQENSDGTPSLSLGSMSSELSGNPETKVNGPYSKNSDVQISVPLQFIINASSIEAEKIKKMIELRVPPIVRDVLSDILDSEFQTI